MQKWVGGFAALVITLAALPQAGAQDYPNKPIRLVVPFPPGGGNDLVARQLAPQVEALVKQPVVIDNRAGANGIIGSQVVAKAEPDGYTVLHMSSAFTVNASVYKKLPFDILTDFAPVANVGIGTGYVLVVNPKLPIHTVADLIEHAKKNKVFYGSPGTGNPIQLCSAIFGVAAGIDIEEVQFRGAGPALAAVIEGSVPFMFTTPGSVRGHVQNGLVRAIGFSSDTRSKDFPDVPTVRETVKNFHFDGVWHGWFAPAKTPAHIVEYLNRQVRAAVKVPKLAEGMRMVGYEPQDRSVAEFTAFVKQSAADMAVAVKAAKIEPQ
jgi:tripartite-type tricarboxylate transporter receptor subunit TctC